MRKLSESLYDSVYHKFRYMKQRQNGEGQIIDDLSISEKATLSRWVYRLQLSCHNPYSAIYAQNTFLDDAWAA